MKLLKLIRSSRQRSIAFGLIIVFTLSTVVALFLNMPTETEAAWWDDSYGYRHRVSFTHDADISTSRAVTFTLDTAELIAASLMQSDCDDTRFTDINGLPLSYDLTGTCNNASTTYEVIFPTVVNGSNVFYVYYGNTTAVNAEVDSTGYTALTPSGGDPSLTNPTSSGNQEKAVGPVAYWSLDDGTGTLAQDSSSNNHDGTITGATWQTEDMCISEKCLSFDGTDDYVRAADSNVLDFTTAFTITGWFRASDISQTQSLVGKWGSSTGNGRSYRTSIVSSKLNVAVSSDGLGSNSLAGTTTLESNKWYHYAAVYNGSSTSLTLYLNGRPDGSTTASVPSAIYSSTSSSICIGAVDSSTDNDDVCETLIQYLKGFQDDIKIYNYARSAAQIKVDYNSWASATSEGSSAVLGSNNQNLRSLSDGLAGYWEMEGTSSPSLDSSGNTNSGTWTGNAASTTGKFGNGITLDGTSDYIQLSDSTRLSPGAGDFTVTSWFKTTTSYPSGSSSAGYIYNDYGADTNHVVVLEVGDQTSSVLRCAMRDGAGNTMSAKSAGTVNNGVWRHAVCVRNGTTILLYLDGALVDSASNSSIGTITTSGGSAPVIGAYSDAPTDEEFNGQLDEVRFYNRSLSSTEVSQLYNFAPGPVGYWKLDEKSGVSAFSSSANGNTGTLTDGPAWTQGKFGSAVNFDGVDDYINTGANTAIDSIAGELTAVAWVKPDALTGRIFSHARTTSDGFGFSITATGLTFTTFGIKDYDIATTLVVGNWYHVAAVLDSSFDVTFYVNGVNVGTTTHTVGIDTNTDDNFYIGASTLSGSSTLTAMFDGVIDEVKIYNYARTQKQIVSDMNAGHPNVGSPVGSAIGYWAFDEGVDNTCSGGTNDACNSGNAGSTLDGAQSGMAVPATATSGRTNSGKFNKALSFDGSNDYVNIGDVLYSDTLTVSAWIKFPSLPSTVRNIVVKRNITGSTDGTNTNEYQLTLNSSGQIAWAAWDSGGSLVGNVTGSRVLSTGTWYYVVATHGGSGGSASIYINGVLDNSSSVTGTISNEDSLLQFGTRAFNDDNRWWNGQIDEVKIYNFALTADEVKLDYNRGSSIVLGTEDTGSKLSDGAGNPPIAEWKLDEKTGQTAYDTAGGGYNFVLGASSSIESTDPRWVRGKYGNSLKFDGVDDLYLGSPVTTATSNITMEAWIYPTASPTNAGYIFYNGNGASNGYGLILNDGSCASGLRVTVLAGGLSCNATGTSTNVGLNSWTHVAIVLSGSSSWSLYLNGRLNSTGTRTVNTPTTSTTVGAGDFGGGQGFIGDIDDVKIFNYARTASQIAFDYNKGAPVGWWKMDECQGTTAYDSAPNSSGGFNGNNGTLNPGDSSGDNDTAGSCNSGTTTEMWNDGTTGKRNASLGFDGTNDYVQITDTPQISPTSQVTVAFWVYPTAVSSSGTDETIVWKGNLADGADQSYGFIWSTTPQAIFRIGSTSAADTLGSPTVPLNQWTHIVGVYDGSNMRTYFDGRQVSSKSTSITALKDTVHPLLVGASYTTTPFHFFQGLVDDVRIYNYALSPTQVKEIANDGTVFFGPSQGSP